MSDAHSGSPEHHAGAREPSAAEDERDLLWTLVLAFEDATDNGDPVSIDTLRNALAHHGIAIVWVDPQTTFSA